MTETHLKLLNWINSTNSAPDNWDWDLIDNKTTFFKCTIGFVDTDIAGARNSVPHLASVQWIYLSVNNCTNNIGRCLVIG